MGWDIEKTTRFIQDFHDSPELWNNKLPDYNDRKQKYHKLKQIALKHDCTMLEAKKKIKNLRSAFHRERKKLQPLQPKRNASTPTKKAKWFAYDLLSFLADDEDDFFFVFSDEELEESDQSVIADIDEAANPAEGPIQCTRYTRASEKKNGKAVVAKRTLTRLSSATHEEDDCKTNVFHRDECSMYGEHVGNELRSLSSRACTIVKHIIHQTLFEAAMGKYDSEDVPIPISASTETLGK